MWSTKEWDSYEQKGRYVRLGQYLDAKALEKTLQQHAIERHKIMEALTKNGVPAGVVAELMNLYIIELSQRAGEHATLLGLIPGVDLTMCGTVAQRSFVNGMQAALYRYQSSIASKKSEDVKPTDLKLDDLKGIVSFLEATHRLFKQADAAAQQAPQTEPH